MRAIGLHRGFTLVEVLVATALLALVMLGLLTAMRSFAQSETRIDERIRIDDDLRVSERFLRLVMGNVSPRPRATPAGAQKEIDFFGGADRMRWIGVMPARHGAGGLYRFHLYARAATAEGPAALVLEFFPFVPGFEAPLGSSRRHHRAFPAVRHSGPTSMPPPPTFREFESGTTATITSGHGSRSAVALSPIRRGSRSTCGHSASHCSPDSRSS
jgi:general secretion pathway protein J